MRSVSLEEEERGMKGKVWRRLGKQEMVAGAELSSRVGTYRSMEGKEVTSRRRFQWHD